MSPGGEADLDRARSAWSRGCLAEARLGYRRALGPAQDAHDAVAAAECALGLSGFWVNEIRAPDEYLAHRELLQQLATELGDADPVLRARVRVRIAADAVYGEGGDRAELETMVRELEGRDARAYAEGLALLHHTLLAPHSADQRTPNLGELTRAAARADDALLQLASLSWVTIDAILAGDPDAPRMLNRWRTRAQADDHALLAYLADVVDTMFLLRGGRLAEVESRLGVLHQRGQEVGEVDADLFLSGQLLTVRWLQGRVSELLEGARAMADTVVLTRFNRVYPAVVAAIAAELGEHDEARVALARVAPFAAEPRGLEASTMWMLTMFAVVEAVHALGDAADARLAYDALTPFAAFPIVGSLAVVCFGSVHWSLARCADAWGDADLAISHLETAIDDDLRLGNLPMLAMSRAELARLLRSRAQPGDRTAARVLLDQAITAGDRFGMTERVAEWRRRAERARGPRAEPAGSMVRRGDLWEIVVDDVSVVIPHSVGIEMLAALVSSPHQEIPVARLAGVELPAARQDVLDEPARRSLARRRTELAAELEDQPDSSRREHTRHEIASLDDALRATTALGGRPRSFTDESERARTSTQKAIRRTIDRIAMQAPELASALRASIHTGIRCRFDPAPTLPARWHVDRTP